MTDSNNPLQRRRFLTGATTAGLAVLGTSIASRPAMAATGTLQGVYNIKDFGAIGDGIADDTTAIQDAIDAARASGGGAVYIPTGTFKTTSALVIPRNPSVSLLGAHWERSQIVYHGIGGAVIELDIVKDNIFDQAEFANFTIDGQNGLPTRGIDLRSSSTANGFRWCTFRNLLIRGARQGGTTVAGSVGINIEFGVLSTFQNVISRDWDTGFELDELGSPGRCSMLDFFRCTAQDCTKYGWFVDDGSRGCQWYGSRVEVNTGTADYGFYFNGNLGVRNQADDHVLISCETEDDYQIASFHFQNQQNTKMFGGGPGTDDVGNGINLRNSRHCTFQGVKFASYAAGHALSLDASCVNNWILGGYIEDSSRWLAIDDQSGNRNVLQFGFTANLQTPMIFKGLGVATHVTTISGVSSASVDVREPGLYLVDATSGNVQCGLTSATQPYYAGIKFVFKKIDDTSSTVRVDPASSAEIDGVDHKLLTSQWDWIEVTATGNGNWVQTGGNV